MRIQVEVIFDAMGRKSRVNVLAIWALMCGGVWCVAPVARAQSGSAGGRSSAAATASANSTRADSASASASSANANSKSLTADEIVRNLVQQNERRAEALKGYTDRRVYKLAYKGFASLKGSMTVDARYTAPADKQFQIISESGSTLLVNRALKKLLQTEQEAAKDPGATAVSPANYTFTLLGEQVIGGRRCYRMHVEPKKNSKFLYRGTIFVDAQDFAVAEIDAEPAKNPSFWITKTQIHHTYGKTGDFWLPEHNRSESSIRMGGSAVLTIDYGTYSVQGALSR